MTEIDYPDFEKIELRVGTVIKAENFAEARKPALKVWVDFGPEFGVRQTSAQITVHCTPENLPGKQVIGCINLGIKKIAGFKSEFLLTGFSDHNGAIILAVPENPVAMGEKLL